MGTELVTTAFETVTPMSYWWIVVPVVLGVVVIILGSLLDREGLLGVGMVIFFAGGFFTFIAAAVQISDFNENLLRSDAEEQLKIEKVVKDGDWYTGMGPDGEFVRFALVEKDGVENTYAVLVEK